MKCYRSNIRGAGLILLYTALMTAGWLMATHPGFRHQFEGWIVLVGLGACLPLALWQLLSPGVAVIIDERGIEDRRTSFGLIRWEDMVSLRLVEMHMNQLLCIRVASPEIYLKRLSMLQRLFSRMNSAGGLGHIVLGFALVKPGIGEVWTYIDSTHPEKTRGGENLKL